MSSWEVLKKLLSRTGDAAPQYIAGIAGLGLINYVFNAMFAIALAIFTRALMNGSRSTLNQSVLFFLIIGLAGSVSVLFAGRALVIGALRSERHVRSATFAAVNKAPLTVLERLGPGEVLSRLTNDTAIVGLMYRQTLQDIANTLLASVGSVITVLVIDWRAGLFIVGLSSLMLLVTFPLLGPMKRQSAAVQEAKAAFLGDVGQLARGTAVVRSFNLTTWMTSRIWRRSDHSLHAGLAATTTQALRATVDVMTDTTLVGLIAYGAYRSALDPSFIPRLVALIQMSNGFTMLFSQLSRILGDLQVSLASGIRVLEMMDLPAEPHHLTGAGAEPWSARAGVVASDLEFTYAGMDSPVISNISFSVRKGSTIAFVGPSGGGKSTLFKLLLGLYTPTHGVITVDSNSVYGEALADWRTNFAYVP